MSYINVIHLGIEPHEWLSALDFYEKDLLILDARLLEVSGKNTGKEAAIELEHFQNQFSIQRQNIRDLKHRIKANNKVAASQAQRHVSHVSTDVVTYNSRVSEDMKQFELLMKDLRQQFNIFLSKWM
jgi:hypothetical protein